MSHFVGQRMSLLFYRCSFVDMCLLEGMFDLVFVLWCSTFCIRYSAFVDGVAFFVRVHGVLFLLFLFGVCFLSWVSTLVFFLFLLCYLV